MTAQPAAKADELLKEAINLLHQEERDQFALNRLKRDAKALLKTDAFNAHILLGILAGLEHEIDDMRKHHLAALKMNQKDPIAIINYSTSLNNLGFSSEAKEYAIKAHMLNPGDLLICDFAIRRSLVSGNVQEARGLTENWRRISPEKQHDLNDLILEISNFLIEKKINDDDLENLIEMSFFVLHKHNIFEVGGTMEILEDEESEWLNYFIEIDKPVQEIVDLDYEASVKEARSNIPAHVSGNVVVTFTSADKNGD